MTGGGGDEQGAQPVVGDATTAVAPPGAVERDAPQAQRPDPFGLRETLDLVRRTGAVLREHWLPLLAIAVVSVVAHELLARLAVVAGRAGAVPGFLALALVPLSAVVALVGMLLVLRTREARRSDLWGVVAAVGSVLVPFLVVYESRGDLRADLVAYSRAGVLEDIAADVESQRLPQIGSFLVLSIVLAALLVRSVGGRLVHRRWSDTDDPRRGALQVLVGYAEAVWVLLGAWVVTAALGNVEAWWSTRVIAQRIFAAWADVSDHLPSLGAVGDWVTAALPFVTDAAVTGLVVPLSILTIAVIVYGIQVADAVPHETVLRAVHRGRWRSLTGRVGDAPLLAAWDRLADPGSRFGALAGGAGLVLRSAFAPVLAYCVLVTLVAQLDVLVWWLARAVLGYRSELVWVAWYRPLTDLSEMLTTVLTVALTAVFADRLLTRLGAVGQLRTAARRRRQGSGSSTNDAGGKSRESTRTETGTASSGTSTSVAWVDGTGSSSGSDVPHMSSDT